MTDPVPYSRLALGIQLQQCGALLRLLMRTSKQIADPVVLESSFSFGRREC